MVDIYRNNSFSRGFSAENSNNEVDSASVALDNNLDDFEMPLFDKRLINEILDDDEEDDDDTDPPRFTDDQNNALLTSLNPNAEEYNPTKDSNSASSTSSRERKKNTGLLSQSPPDGDHEFLSYVESIRPNFKSVISPKRLASFSSESETQSSISPDESLVPSQNTTVLKDDTSLVDYFHFHFQTLIKSGNKDQLTKSYCTLKFLLHQLEKSNHFTQDKETNTSTVLMKSTATMKTDEEYEDLIKLFENLRLENQEYSGTIENLQSNLSKALDKQKEMQNKNQVEITTLKQQLEENQSTYVEEIRAMKKKQSSLEKELKASRQKCEDLVVKEEKTNSENCLLSKKLMNLESVSNKIDQLVSENMTLKRESQLRESSQAEIIKEYEKQFKELECEYKQTQNEFQVALLRVKQAELQILNMTADSFHKSFLRHQEYTNQKIHSLQLFLNDRNVPSAAMDTIQTIQTNFKTMIVEVKDAHQKFMLEVMSHKRNIENGIPLLQLKPLTIPTLPPIPPVESLISQLMPNIFTPNGNLLSGLIPPSGNITPTFGHPRGYSPTNLLPNLNDLPTGSLKIQSSPQNSHSVSSLSSFSLDELNKNVNSSFTKPPTADSTIKMPPGLSWSKPPSVVGSDIVSVDISKTASTLSLDSIKSREDSLELDYAGPKKAGYQASDTSSVKTSTKKKCKGIAHVIMALKLEFPHKDERSLMQAIEEYRKMKSGLSGIPIATIISGIKEIILKHEPKRSIVSVRPKVLVNKPLTSCSEAIQPPVAKPVPSLPQAPWASVSDRPLNNWTNQNFEKVCSICFEDMPEHKAYRVDCNHLFHLECIRKWLSKQSNCPICRVHLLLPDDFPTLS